jgi:hypothetical protein
VQEQSELQCVTVSSQDSSGIPCTVSMCSVRANGDPLCQCDSVAERVFIFVHSQHFSEYVLNEMSDFQYGFSWALKRQVTMDSHGLSGDTVDAQGILGDTLTLGGHTGTVRKSPPGSSVSSRAIRNPVCHGVNVLKKTP